MASRSAISFSSWVRRSAVVPSFAAIRVLGRRQVDRRLQVIQGANLALDQGLVQLFERRLDVTAGRLREGERALRKGPELFVGQVQARGQVAVGGLDQVEV
jgi:hypothetical protein